MTIPFKSIPSNLRTPLFYAEIDNSKANTNEAPERALLIGPKLASGTLTPNVAVVCQSASDSRATAGSGSVLASMIDAYRANDPNGEMWVGPVSDDGSAVAATGAITFGGTSTRLGTYSIYIAGRLVSVPIAIGTTGPQSATLVAAAINAAVGLPVTAAVDGVNLSKVNLTARHAGEVGNEIDLRYNYRGAAAGEFIPFGTSVTFTAMTGGTTNPSLATLLANLGDMTFDFIACAFTDATSLAAIATLLADDTGRWSWSTQLYGHCFIAKRGTAGANATFATALNNQHISNIAFTDSPSPAWKWASALAGAAAVAIRADPALTLQFLTLKGILPPPTQSLFPQSIRNNTLLYGGCSTWTVVAGEVVLENVITTYVTNAQGNPDDSYLEVETLFLTMYVLRQLRAVVTQKYNRIKLAADGTRVNPGTSVVTPTTIKMDLIAKYLEMEAAGYVQQSAEFAANVIVEQNATNKDRIDVVYPSHHINNLRVFALLYQFYNS